MGSSVFRQERQICENSAYMGQNPTGRDVGAVSEGNMVQSSSSTLKSNLPFQRAPKPGFRQLQLCTTFTSQFSILPLASATLGTMATGCRTLI